MGSVSMITPVENGSTCSGATPSRPASASQPRRARQPVGADAGVGVAGVDQQGADRRARGEPLLTELHRGGAEAVAGEDAGHRAALVEANKTRSRRFGLRIAAIVVPRRRPGAGSSCAGSGAVRWTGMAERRERPARDAVAGSDERRGPKCRSWAGGRRNVHRNTRLARQPPPSRLAPPSNGGTSSRPLAGPMRERTHAAAARPVQHLKPWPRRGGWARPTR